MIEVDLDASKLVLGTNFLPVSTFYCSSSRGFLFRKLFLLHGAYHRSFPGIQLYQMAHKIFFTSLEAMGTLKMAFLPPAKRGGGFWETFPVPSGYEH
jgi:hypothetical protein